MLWEVAGDSKNYNVLTGHKNAVLEVQWSSSSSSLISCSADKTVGKDYSLGKNLKNPTSGDCFPNKLDFIVL